MEEVAVIVIVSSVLSAYRRCMLEALRQRLNLEGIIEMHVRVRPHARVTQLKSIMDDGSVKIDVAAAAEDNKANIALLRFLAEAFDVQESKIEIVSGMTARTKSIRICL